MRDCRPGRVRSPFIATLVLLVAASATWEGAGSAASAGKGHTAAGPRLRPPPRVQCPRDRLTSFTGAVRSFDRREEDSVISLESDEGTFETFVLTHPKGADPTKWFLLRGKPFAEHDWPKIHSAGDGLRPNTRATIWVCADGTNPIVDWVPPRPVPERAPE